MKQSKKGVRYGTVFFIVVATAILTAIATYFYVSRMVENLGRDLQIYSKLNKVNDLVNESFILDVDAVSGADRIADGIVEGYINGLGDPYSYYLNEKNFRVSASASASNTKDVGIRAAFDKQTGCIRVDFVRKNSPAEEAGVERGDLITSVDGKSVTSLGYNNAVSLLSGTEGEDVLLTYTREGVTLPTTVPVAYEEYTVQTVEYRLLESGVGYMFINEFAPTTVSEFSAALESLRDTGSRGLILDVRFNAGGDFDSMLAVLDKIMAAGIMCSVKDANGEEFYTSDEAHISDQKIIVLQNSVTSDVAEIFVAALRDSDSAILVGTKTLGKGVGQTEIGLSDRSAIYISTKAYVTPNGDEFNGVGIGPDEPVELPEEKMKIFRSLAPEDDDQLQKALELMRSLIGSS